MRGNEHPQFSGGSVNLQGYRTVSPHVFGEKYLSILAPMVVRGAGNVLEHRAIMAISLGRALQPWETVHHIDGSKQNNSFENLVVLTKRQHGRAHQELQRLAFLLVRAGLIRWADGGYTFSSQLERLLKHA